MICFFLYIPEKQIKPTERVICMASTSKCPFCGAVVRSDEKTCPQCGGANPQYVSDSPRRIFQPKTIAELQEYCAERGMPLQRMRFFIGENYREARAFGIYKAGDNRFVVYKNKADGSRAVRYDGPDEAFAVRELFEKLLSECHNRGIYPDGPVQRTAGSGSGSPDKRSFFRRHPILTVWLCLVALALGIHLINTISNSVRNAQEINRQVEAFRADPKSFNSKKIGNRWYVYDVNKGEVVSSNDDNNHLNDGYYRDDTRPSNNNVLWRNGSDWNYYDTAEEDWDLIATPSFSSLGKTLAYLGTDWQSSWNVPDFRTFPVDEGYYQCGEKFFYRDYLTNARKTGVKWYIYQEDPSDWVASSSPVKAGIPPTEAVKLNRYKLPDGLKKFDESTPYALANNLSGYYRQGDRFYYLAKYSKQPPKTPYVIINKYQYVEEWYTYGVRTDSAGEETAGTDGKKWYLADDEPVKESLTFLGSSLTEQQQEYGVPDFRESAAGLQVTGGSGYVKQGENLYYHYKDTWYRTGADSDSWERSSGPSAEISEEIFLGNSYETFTEEDWDEDWTATDFKTSDTWKRIEADERAEAARKEAERQKEAEKRERENERRNSRDYDSWDSSDTDWDSDW